MAKILNQAFPPLAPDAIASYDYTDIANGLGVINFKAFTTETSAGVAYVLGTNNIYSAVIGNYSSSAGIRTLTFDSSPFNAPRTADGTAYLSYGVAGAATAQISGAAIIQKWNGTTATTMGGLVIGPTFTAAAGKLGEMQLLPFNLTQTRIAKGEQLRLVFYMSSAGADDTELGHDPQGRDGLVLSGASVTSAMNLFIPFKTEVGL